MSDKLTVHNGQSWPLEQIPDLDHGVFRREILDGCQKGGRLVNLFSFEHPDAKMRLCAILGMDQEARLTVFNLKLASGEAQFESLTPVLPQAHLFEREIAEQFAISPKGHPWLKPLRYHRNYRGVADIWPGIDTNPIPGVYPFYQVNSEETHEVAVGPVHAGIIEPGHFRFQCHGEEILNLEIQLGYQHRGVERMMVQETQERAMLIAESVAGDTVIGHGAAFCNVMELLSGIEAPLQAQMIRAIALELERLSNHVGDLGALSADIGFLPVSAYYGRLRGDFLAPPSEACAARAKRATASSLPLLKCLFHFLFAYLRASFSCNF